MSIPLSVKIDRERMELVINAMRVTDTGGGLYEIRKKIKFILKLPEDEHREVVHCISVSNVVEALQNFGRDVTKTDIYNYFSENRGNGNFLQRLKGAEITKL